MIVVALVVVLVAARFASGRVGRTGTSRTGARP